MHDGQTERPCHFARRISGPGHCAVAGVGWIAVCAESCTCGWLAERFVEVDGAGWQTCAAGCNSCIAVEVLESVDCALGCIWVGRAHSKSYATRQRQVSVNSRTIVVVGEVTGLEDCAAS